MSQAAQTTTLAIDRLWCLAMAPVRIMVPDLLRGLSEALSVVAVGDRPYYSRWRLLVRQHLLRLEARTLGVRGMASESGSAAITSCGDIDRATKERRLSSRRGRSGDRPSLNI